MPSLAIHLAAELWWPLELWTTGRRMLHLRNMDLWKVSHHLQTPMERGGQAVPVAPCCSEAELLVEQRELASLVGASQVAKLPQRRRKWKQHLERSWPLASLLRRSRISQVVLVHLPVTEVGRTAARQARPLMSRCQTPFLVPVVQPADHAFPVC